MYACDREIRITKPIEQNGSTIIARDLYKGGGRFESRQEHKFSLFPPVLQYLTRNYDPSRHSLSDQSTLCSLNN
jgi:hypothetical protein